MIEIELEDGASADFAAAIAAMKLAEVRPELSVTQIPEPKRLASEAIAFAADVNVSAGKGSADPGTGRFVLLHETTPQDGWESNFRIVAFAKSPLDTFIGEDPMASQVAWSWLIDALKSRGASFSNAAGTATRIISSGFGSLTGQSDHAEIELRASWSPSGNFTAQLEAWQDLVCMMSGLPQLPTSVITLPKT